MARVLVIDAHPDPDPSRFCHALAASYGEGVREGGHTLTEISLARMDLPFLRTRDEWERGTPPQAVKEAQDILQAADHILVVFPLWLGDIPAVLKAFLEQTMRPGFAFSYGDGKSLPRKLLKGKSARLVVTMGMPAFIYRWYFGAHSMKSLRRNIFAFVGVKPVRLSIIGGVESIGDANRKRWLDEMRRLGRAAE